MLLMCISMIKVGIDLIPNRRNGLSLVMEKMSLATIFGIMKTKRQFIVEM